MNIKVRAFGNLKDHIGTREDIIDIPSNTLLTDLHNIISDHYGDLFSNQIFEGQSSHIRVLINGLDSFLYDDSFYVFKEGDTVTLLPPMAGG